MERSLTIVLPIRHATESLSATVHRMLEILPDLTRRFEVLLVDDGALEAAGEAARELARHYPQVRVVASGDASGSRDSALRTALEQSRGEVVFLGEDGCGGQIQEIDRLWRGLDRSPGGGVRTSEHRGVPAPRFQLLRRGERTNASQDGLAAERRKSPQPTRPNFLSRLGSYTLEE